MQTTFFLLAQYSGRSDVPLEDVARDYLGLDARTAKDRAARGKLPFPAWRAPSQKAPWLVNISDLAVWIDRERARAERDRLQQVAA